MSSGVFIKVCSKEFKISSGESEPKGKFSQCLSNNQDIIYLVIAAIFATFAVLTDYKYITTFGSTHPMFAAGCLASCAAFAFTWGLMRAITTRGCIVVRKNDQLNQV